MIDTYITEQTLLDLYTATIPIVHKNKIVVGDLNGSVVYSHPIKTCIKHGLGGNSEAAGSKVHMYGQHLSGLWKSQNMEDISAKCKHAWATTRTDPNNTNNKLDCKMVSSNVIKDLSANVTLNKQPRCTEMI